MSTLTADPDLDRLLDDDTERVCELTDYSGWTLEVGSWRRTFGVRELRRCRRPAAWVVYLRFGCDHNGPTAKLCCDPCLREVLGDGPALFGCEQTSCPLAACITHVEPLR